MGGDDLCAVLSEARRLHLDHPDADADRNIRIDRQEVHDRGVRNGAVRDRQRLRADPTWLGSAQCRRARWSRRRRSPRSGREFRPRALGSSVRRVGRPGPRPSVPALMTVGQWWSRQRRPRRQLRDSSSSVDGGSVAGGSVDGGSVAGGSVAGGSVAGGSVTDGSVTDGSVTGASNTSGTSLPTSCPTRRNATASPHSTATVDPAMRRHV